MKINISPQSAPKRKGFTLIELLVSMTVTMVIIGVLMAMTRVAVSGMQSSQNATRYSRISQEVMTSVSKDLEGIVIRTGNPYTWVKVGETSSSDEELGPSGKQIPNPIEMSFFSAVTDRYNGQIGVDGVDLGGDISFVRYKLAYRDIIDFGDTKYPVFSLYRKRIDPKDTFDDYLSKDEDDPTQVLPDFGNVTGNDLLAENVFDMTISFNFEYVDNGVTIFKRVPVMLNATGGYTELIIKGDEIVSKGGSAIPANARLSSADVSILVLSDAGMNGLKNAKITSDKELSNYLRKHGKHFSKSVVLPRP